VVIKIINAALAILAGVGGALVLFWLLNAFVERLPGRWEHRVKPLVFVGPALAVIGLFLVYPAVRTVVLSFANDDSTAWVGLDNYVEIFSSPDFRQTLVNNLLWLAVVPAVAVVIGLLVAVLADKLSSRGEKVTKSLIFLPMAISFVGAATIWRFVYEWRPEGRPQIGLLNAIWTAFGAEPVSWLQLSTANINDLLLMVIVIWLQAGFCMVLLSAAIKTVPEDTLEAARIDGANEVQVFFRVVVPQIRGTIITVFITVLILGMKIFDVVCVMTGGNFGTNVIGLEFVTQLFEFGNDGRAAAVVVILMLAVVPFGIYQVRQFRREEAVR
jgi:alpha-glucoside transport system permease protein